MTNSSDIKTVYLAGPMTGLPDFNFPKFNAMARSIRARGFIVLNPAESFGGDQTLTRSDYTVKDVALVAGADAVAVMRDWEKSSGTRFETHQAALLKKPVIDAEILATSGVVVSINVDERGNPLPTPAPVHTNLDVPSFWYEQAFQKLRDGRVDRVAGGPLSPEPKANIHKGFKGPVPAAPPLKLSPIDEWALKAGQESVDRFEAKKATKERHCAGDDCDSYVPAQKQVTDYDGKVDGGGYKSSMDDTKKLPLWLIPNALGQAAARALQHGAAKYAPNNWRKGMSYSEVYSALQRHLTAWLEGDDLDDETKLNHLDHAAACLGFLTEYVANNEYHKFDNRFKRQKAA